MSMIICWNYSMSLDDEWTVYDVYVWPEGKQNIMNDSRNYTQVKPILVIYQHHVSSMCFLLFTCCVSDGCVNTVWSTCVAHHLMWPSPVLTDWLIGCHSFTCITQRQDWTQPESNRSTTHISHFEKTWVWWAQHVQTAATTHLSTRLCQLPVWWYSWNTHNMSV